MQEYLPSEAYKAVINAIEKGTPINREMADMIANGMKNWAKTFNAVSYTHLCASLQVSPLHHLIKGAEKTKETTRE